MSTLPWATAGETYGNFYPEVLITGQAKNVIVKEKGIHNYPYDQQYTLNPPIYVPAGSTINMTGSVQLSDNTLIDSSNDSLTITFAPWIAHVASNMQSKSPSRADVFPLDATFSPSGTNAAPAYCHALNSVNTITSPINGWKLGEGFPFSNDKTVPAVTNRTPFSTLDTFETMAVYCRVNTMVQAAPAANGLTLISNTYLAGETQGMNNSALGSSNLSICMPTPVVNARPNYTISTTSPHVTTPPVCYRILANGSHVLDLQDVFDSTPSPAYTQPLLDWQYFNPGIHQWGAYQWNSTNLNSPLTHTAYANNFCALIPYREKAFEDVQNPYTFYVLNEFVHNDHTCMPFLTRRDVNAFNTAEGICAFSFHGGAAATNLTDNTPIKLDPNSSMNSLQSGSTWGVPDKLSYHPLRHLFQLQPGQFYPCVISRKEPHIQTTKSILPHVETSIAFQQTDGVELPTNQAGRYGGIPWLPGHNNAGIAILQAASHRFYHTPLHIRRCIGDVLAPIGMQPQHVDYIPTLAGNNGCYMEKTVNPLHAYLKMASCALLGYCAVNEPVHYETALFPTVTTDGDNLLAHRPVLAVPSMADLAPVLGYINAAPYLNVGYTSADMIPVAHGECLYNLPTANGGLLQIQPKYNCMGGEAHGFIYDPETEGFTTLFTVTVKYKWPHGAYTRQKFLEMVNTTFSNGGPAQVSLTFNLKDENGDYVTPDNASLNNIGYNPLLHHIIWTNADVKDDYKQLFPPHLTDGDFVELQNPARNWLGGLSSEGSAPSFQLPPSFFSSNLQYTRPVGAFLAGAHVRCTNRFSINWDQAYYITGACDQLIGPSTTGQSFASNVPIVTTSTGFYTTSPYDPQILGVIVAPIVNPTTTTQTVPQAVETIDQSDPTYIKQGWPHIIDTAMYGMMTGQAAGVGPIFPNQSNIVGAFDMADTSLNQYAVSTLAAWANLIFTQEVPMTLRSFVHCNPIFNPTRRMNVSGLSGITILSFGIPTNINEVNFLSILGFDSKETWFTPEVFFVQFFEGFQWQSTRLSTTKWSEWSYLQTPDAFTYLSPFPFDQPSFMKNRRYALDENPSSTACDCLSLNTGAPFKAYTPSKLTNYTTMDTCLLAHRSYPRPSKGVYAPYVNETTVTYHNDFEQTPYTMIQNSDYRDQFPAYAPPISTYVPRQWGNISTQAVLDGQQLFLNDFSLGTSGLDYINQVVPNAEHGNMSGLLQFCWPPQKPLPITSPAPTCDVPGYYWSLGTMVAHDNLLDIPRSLNTLVNLGTNVADTAYDYGKAYTWATNLFLQSESGREIIYGPMITDRAYLGYAAYCQAETPYDDTSFPYLGSFGNTSYTDGAGRWKPFDDPLIGQIGYEDWAYLNMIMPYGCQEVYPNPDISTTLSVGYNFYMRTCISSVYSTCSFTHLALSSFQDHSLVIYDGVCSATSYCLYDLDTLFPANLLALGAPATLQNYTCPGPQATWCYFPTGPSYIGTTIGGYGLQYLGSWYNQAPPTGIVFPTSRPGIGDLEIVGQDLQTTARNYACMGGLWIIGTASTYSMTAGARTNWCYEIGSPETSYTQQYAHYTLTSVLNQCLFLDPNDNIKKGPITICFLYPDGTSGQRSGFHTNGKTNHMIIDGYTGTFEGDGRPVMKPWSTTDAVDNVFYVETPAIMLAQLGRMVTNADQFNSLGMGGRPTESKLLSFGLGTHDNHAAVLANLKQFSLNTPWTARQRAVWTKLHSEFTTQSSRLYGFIANRTNGGSDGLGYTFTQANYTNVQNQYIGGPFANPYPSDFSYTGPIINLDTLRVNDPTSCISTTNPVFNTRAAPYGVNSIVDTGVMLVKVDFGTQVNLRCITYHNGELLTNAMLVFLTTQPNSTLVTYEANFPPPLNSGYLSYVRVQILDNQQNNLVQADEHTFSIKVVTAYDAPTIGLPAYGDQETCGNLATPAVPTQGVPPLQKGYVSVGINDSLPPYQPQTFPSANVDTVLNDNQPNRRGFHTSFGSDDDGSDDSDSDDSDPDPQPYTAKRPRSAASSHGNVTTSNDYPNPFNVPVMGQPPITLGSVHPLQGLWDAAQRGFRALNPVANQNPGLSNTMTNVDQAPTMAQQHRNPVTNQMQNAQPTNNIPQTSVNTQPNSSDSMVAPTPVTASQQSAAANAHVMTTGPTPQQLFTPPVTGDAPKRRPDHVNQATRNASQPTGTQRQLTFDYTQSSRASPLNFDQTIPSHPTPFQRDVLRKAAETRRHAASMKTEK